MNRTLTIKRRNQDTTTANPKQNPQSGKQKPKNKRTQKIDGRTANYGKQIGSIVNNGYGGTLKMYPSTQMFAKVYGDPFLKESARIPCFPIRATKMQRIYASSSGVLNGDGFGFITVIPANCVTNDLNAVFYSNGPTSPPFLSTTGSVGATSANSPYASSDYKFDVNGKAMRIVAQAIRVRYVGTTLNAAGSCYCAQLSPIQSAQGYNIDELKRQMGWKEYVFSDRSWHTICRHITDNNDLLYQYWDADGGKWAYYNGTPTSQDNFPYYGMIMTGVAGQPFEWEVVTHIEIVAPNLDQIQVVHQDAPGVSHVVASYAKARNRDNTSIDHSSGTNKWVKILKDGIETATTIGKAIIPFLL